MPELWQRCHTLPGRPASRRERSSREVAGRRAPAPRFFAAETTALEGTLLATLFAAPLMLGSVYPWAIAVLLALSVALALGLLVLPRLKDGPIPWFGLVLCAVVLLLAVQAIPMPAALATLLSPRAAETYRESLVPQAMRRFHPLSLDGPATGVELAKALVCAVVFAASFVLGRRERSRRRLCMALVGTGLLVALIGYGHRLANLDQLFGFYRFREVRPAFLTTLANKNNLAGLLCLCAPPALALALSTGERKRAMLWGVAYILMGAAIFLTLSRGGMIAFVLGQLLLAVLLPRSVASLGIRTALSVGSLLVAGYLALGELTGRLMTLAPELVGKEYKLQGIREASAMLLDYPLVGIGRGAFPTVGAHYLSIPLGTAEYVENETLQPLIDLGLPVGGLLLLGAVVLWFRAVRPHRPGPVTRNGFERSPLTAGLAAGLGSLFAQNQVDFSLEISGVAVPAMVALGLLAAEAESPSRRESPERSGPRAALVGAFALLFALPAAWGLWYGRQSWRSEVDDFARRATSAPRFAPLVNEAEPLLLRHPASFALPLALAERGLREKPPANGAALALHFADRALNLKPSNPGAHLVASQALAMLGRNEQSLLEARLYFEASQGDDRALREAIRRTPTLEDLLAAVPPTPEGMKALVKLLVEQQRESDALAVTESWIALAPDSEEAHRERGRALRAGGRLDESERELRRAVELQPEEPAAVAELAALLKDAHKLAEAREALQLGLLAQPGELRLSLDLATLELQSGRPEAAAAILRQARVVGPDERGKVLVLSGDVEDALGHGNRAFTLYDQAAALSPGSSAPWKAAAQLEKLSRFEEAQTYLKRLRAGVGPEAASQIDSRLNQDIEKAKEQRLARERAASERAHERLDVGRKGGAP